MRVGDCESYAKIINWINCELVRTGTASYERIHDVSRHVTFVSTCL